MSREPMAEAVLSGEESGGWEPAAAAAAMVVEGVPKAAFH